MIRNEQATARSGAIGLLALAVLAVGACGVPEPRPRSVDELAADPVVLQGLVARCATSRRTDADEVECANARLAAERLGKTLDAERRRVHDEEFERQRERRRAAEEAQRRAAAEAQPHFDPYSTPIPPAAPAPAADTGGAK